MFSQKSLLACLSGYGEDCCRLAEVEVPKPTVLAINMFTNILCAGGHRGHERVADAGLGLEVCARPGEFFNGAAVGTTLVLPCTVCRNYLAAKRVPSSGLTVCSCIHPPVGGGNLTPPYCQLSTSTPLLVAVSSKGCMLQAFLHET